MSDQRLEKLESYGESLISQDRILADAMRAAGNYFVPVPGAVPIKRIFDAINADFPNLVPAFDYHGHPAALRSQIAEAMRRVRSKIEEVRRDLESEAKRNKLAAPIAKVCEVIDGRAQDGKLILDYPGDTPQELLGQMLPWVQRTLGTLRKCFVSGWHATQFEYAVCLSDLGDPAFVTRIEVLLGCVQRGVDLLKRIDEDLYLSESTAADSSANQTPRGDKIFIGHGRSPVWRELKDFMAERLRLPWDEYNREPCAGIFTPERVRTMLDQASFAFLIMTAEDQQPDGAFRARENEVYEAGLFQGRLGFRRAIILLEEDCTPLSNILGLTVITFSKGRISAAFEDVRRTLEREGVLKTT